jgi:hypothetical protein
MSKKYKNKDVLIYLIKRLMEKKSFYGKLQVMKLMFLIEHYDADSKTIREDSLLGNEYYIYYLGPFSFEISKEFDRLKEEDLKEEIKLDEDLKKKVDFVIDNFGMNDGRTLQKFCLNLLNISIEEKGKYMGFKIKEVLEIKRNQQIQSYQNSSKI